MKFVLAAVGVFAAVMLAVEIPALVRYIKIETM
jgi:hypothetical protein